MTFYSSFLSNFVAIMPFYTSFLAVLTVGRCRQLTDADSWQMPTVDRWWQLTDGNSWQMTRMDRWNQKQLDVYGTRLAGTSFKHQNQFLTSFSGHCHFGKSIIYNYWQCLALFLSIFSNPDNIAAAYQLGGWFFSLASDVLLRAVHKKALKISIPRKTPFSRKISTFLRYIFLLSSFRVSAFKKIHSKKYIHISYSM